MSEKEYIEICILSQPKEIATKNIIQLLEQKDNKINKVIDKMIGDKMEQFDDYVIYLIESYLEILEE